MTEAAFLQAIIAEPGADVHRLVYADWLEENGNAARAEFVRVQCELAKAPAYTHYETPSDCDCGWCALHRREHDLWRRRGAAFGAGLPGAAPAVLPGCVLSSGVERAFSYEFRRGFVKQVTCAADDWLAHGTAIRRCQPVTRVRLTTRPQLYGRRSLAHYSLTPPNEEDQYQLAATDEMILGKLGERFPGVEFTLPAEVER